MKISFSLLVEIAARAQGPHYLLVFELYLATQYLGGIYLGTVAFAPLRAPLDKSELRKGMP